MGDVVIIMRTFIADYLLVGKSGAVIGIVISHNNNRSNSFVLWLVALKLRTVR